jgi:hypothetical protein
MSASVRRISVGAMLPLSFVYGWSRKKTTSMPAGRKGADEADRYRLDQEPLAPVGLRDHVGERERGADAQHEPQRDGDERGRLGEALAPTVAALRLLVEPLCIGCLLPRCRGARRSRTLGPACRSRTAPGRWSARPSSRAIRPRLRRAHSRPVRRADDRSRVTEKHYRRS